MNNPNIDNQLKEILNIKRNTIEKIMNITQMTSRLTIHMSVLISNGYKQGTHYIGMLNSMWLFCAYCDAMRHHELVVRSNNDWKYVCKKCNCCVEYVG